MQVAIGITVSLDPGRRIHPGREYAYIKRSYGRAVRQVGGVPLLLTPEVDPAEALDLCAGLLITGGDGLPGSLPELEAAEAEGVPAGSVPGLSPEVPERIAWERRLLDGFIEAGGPVLGVCYGMQLLNLHLGGTLFDDVANQPNETLDHGGAGRFTEHGLTLCLGGGALAGLEGSSRVASCHVQAVDRVAADLQVTVRAPDGVVEAVEGDSVLGVQWHPEIDASGEHVYGWLVQRAVKSAPGARQR